MTIDIGDVSRFSSERDVKTHLHDLLLYNVC